MTILPIVVRELRVQMAVAAVPDEEPGQVRAARKINETVQPEPYRGVEPVPAPRHQGQRPQIAPGCPEEPDPLRSKHGGSGGTELGASGCANSAIGHRDRFAVTNDIQ